MDKEEIYEDLLRCIAALCDFPTLIKCAPQTHLIHHWDILTNYPLVYY
jgi:hypothetical protein